MKKLIVAAVMIAGFGFATAATAQVRIHINIGNQPAWGPVGYDYARYYYLPEANAYYDVNAARFMYQQRGRWVTGRRLPPAYGRIDLYRTYKVVLDRRYAPYRDNRNDLRHYGKYRNRYHQRIIRDSRNERYYESRYHPKHHQWKGKGQYDRKHGRDDDWDDDRDHRRKGRR